MFAGVSALKAHQLRLDVIGNNMSNVLTVGYKASSTTFAELYYQRLGGASSSSETRGGINPKQVGLGSKVSSIIVNQTGGNVNRTDIPTDLMIDGEGFFVVSNDSTGQNKMYTRAGNFSLDELGFLVTPEGMKVLDADFRPIQINMSDTKSASPTKYLTLSGNLNVNDKDYTSTVDLYDSLGDVHPINVEFKNLPLTTTAKLQIDPLDPRFDPANAAQLVNYSYREVAISDNNGNQVVPAAGNPPWYIKFNEYGEPVDLVTLATPGDPQSASTSVNETMVMEVPGASDITVPLNRSIFFANADPSTGVRLLSQVSKTSEVKATQLYGLSAGRLEKYEISSKGEVYGSYTNGERKVIQTIGLALFDNPPGLSKAGSNLFEVTANSGGPRFGIPSTGSFGLVRAGALEMSNVDLAAQFTDLITTQRGLQANGRIITTSDEILQELVNLKR